MYFKDKEIAKALIELEIANRENLLLLLPIKLETIKRMNRGLIINPLY